MGNGATGTITGVHVGFQHTPSTASDPSFLLMCILGGSGWWLSNLDDLDWVLGCQFWLSPVPAVSSIWGNEPRE